MPNIIDLSTPEKMEAFGKAMMTVAATGKPVDLGSVAEASETLVGPKVCYETEHYLIEDHGEDWRGRYINRFCIQRRAEFRKSRVMQYPTHGSQISAEDLLPSLKAAEKFHMDNLPYCGGF